MSESITKCLNEWNVTVEALGHVNKLENIMLI